jgi:hypothetical protein
VTTTWKIVAAVFLATLIAILCVLFFILGTAQSLPKTGTGLVELPNGEEVMCVSTANGGISCDWDGWLSQ